MLEFPATTNEVIDLDVTGPDGEITGYQVVIVPAGAPAPTAAQITVSAENDGTIWGPRVNGLAAGLWDAYAKIGTRIRGPIRFRLTP